MTDSVEAARAAIARAEALLGGVDHVRRCLVAAQESPERSVFLAMMEALQRGLLEALEGVVEDLKALRADPEAAEWLRRRLEDLK